MTDEPKGDAKSKQFRLTKREAGGTTSAGSGGATSAGSGGTTSAGFGGATSAGSGGATSAGSGGATSAGSGGTTSAGSGGASVIDFGNVWTRTLKLNPILAGRADISYLVTSPESELLKQKEDLEAQLRSTRDSAIQLQKEIDEKSKSASDLMKAKEDLEAKIEEYTRLERLRFLIDRIHRRASDHDDILDLFPLDQMCDAFVMSVDIRRSTDLMLKARHPKDFAEFITELSRQLRETVIKNYGVFDKFTGDGILAFFPTQYSGDDAGLWMLRAAEGCHEAFQKLYRENRKCFNAVPIDTGLGIGVDFGKVQLVQIGGDLTVVGTPVVYACRMGSAPPNTTFINEPAYDVVFEKYSAYCQFEERNANFKNDGMFLAHEARLNGKVCNPKLPAWAESPSSPPDAAGVSGSA